MQCAPTDSGFIATPRLLRVFYVLLGVINLLAFCLERLGTSFALLLGDPLFLLFANHLPLFCQLC